MEMASFSIWKVTMLPGSGGGLSARALRGSVRSANAGIMIFFMAR